MATLATASGYPYPATSETPDVQRDLKALVDYLEAQAGAGTAFTPTFSGTGAAVGNGTLTGKWWKTGKIVHAVMRLTVGSTTTMGTVSQALGSLPFACATGWKVGAQVRYTTAAAGDWMGQGEIIPTATSVFFGVIGTNGAWTQVTSTVPFAWSAGATVDIYVAYPAA